MHIDRWLQNDLSRRAFFRYSGVSVAGGSAIFLAACGGVGDAATADDRTTFDTGTIRTGKRKPLTFDQKGEFKYFCDFHPFMRGKVVVK